MNYGGYVSNASTGTISGVGSTITAFESITIDPNAVMVLSGNSAGLANQEVISGFNGADTIELTGFSASSYQFADNVLTLSNAGAMEHLTLSEPGSVTTANFTIHSTAMETEITLCFYPGTQLAGEYGTVAVEGIKPSTMLKTASGALMPVRWMGQSHISTRLPTRYGPCPSALREGRSARTCPSVIYWSGRITRCSLAACSSKLVRW
jgi:hypothetical protein